MMNPFQRLYRLLLSRTTILLAAVLACVILSLEHFDLPDAIVRELCRCGRHYRIGMSLRSIQFGVFNGISCRNARLKFDTEAGPIDFSANDMKINLSLMNIITGKGLPIEEVAFREGTAQLYTVSGKKLRSLKVSGFIFNTEGGDEGKASVVAEFQGIRLRLTARLLGFTLMQSNDEKSGLVERNIELCSKLEALSRRLEDFDFGIDDTVVTANATINVNEPEKLDLTGAFNVGDAVMAGIMVSRLRGRIHLAEGFVRADDVVWVSDKGMLRGFFSYGFANGMVSSHGEGKVEPAMAVRLFGREFNGADVLGEMTVPWSVKWDIPEVRLGSHEMRVNLECGFKDIEVGGIRLRDGGFKMAFHDDKIRLDNFTVSRDGRDSIKGSLMYDINAETLAFGMKGRCELASLAQALDISLPTELKRNSNLTTWFEINMDESPIKPEKWKVNGSIGVRSLNMKEWSLDNLRAKLALQDGHFTIDDCTFLFGNSELLPGKLSASADISAILSNQKDDIPIAIKHSLELSSNHRGRILTAMAMNGVALLKSKTKTLSLEESGTAFGDRIYNAYLADSKIEDIEYFAPFYCNGKPVEFSFKVPEFKLDDISKFSLEGELKGENCGFGSFAAKTATCGLSIDSSRTLFSNIRGTTLEGYDAALTIEIKHSPFVLEIRNLKFHGDPKVCESYVMAHSANEIYRAIWEDIKWDAASMPDISIPLIRYSSSTEGNPWDFKMEAEINAAHFKYKTIGVADANVKMNIDLPENGVDLKPLSVTLGDTILSGSCHFSTGNQPMLSFKVEEANGSIDIKKMLSSINPELCREFRKVELEGMETFFCEGSMFLNGPKELRLVGNIGANLFRLNDIEISNLNAKWYFENGKIRWDVRDAEYLDGNVKTTGDYDLHSRLGDILLVSKRLSWSKLVSLSSTTVNLDGDDKSKTEDSGDKGNKEVPGHVDFECSMKFMSDWAGRPFHLEGNGHFALREADLWDVPMMRGLEYMLELSTFKLFTSKEKKKAPLGRISSVVTDVEFRGTRVVFPNISTDGTIIALSGSGEYSWERDRLKFYISGEALKDISFISMILKPFTWAFHAELTGTRSKAEWRMRTALSKFAD